MTRRPAARRRGETPAVPRPGTVYRVRRLDQVRALAHPLRLRLFEVFAARVCTTKQAAEVLGESPTRLYHHVAALERVGLVRLRRTRPKRGTIEKYYGAVAPLLEVDPALLPGAAGRPGSGLGRGMAREVLRAMQQDLERCERASVPEEDRPIVARLSFRAPPEEVRRVRQELLGWLADFQKRSDCRVDPRAPSTTLTLAFVPGAAGGEAPTSGGGVRREGRAGRPVSRRRRSTPSD